MTWSRSGRGAVCSMSPVCRSCCYPFYSKYLPESPEFLAINGRQDKLGLRCPRSTRVADLSDVVATPRPEVRKAPVAQLFTNGNALNSFLIWIFFAMCMLLSYGLNTWLPKLMQTAGYALSSALWTLVVLNLGGIAAPSSAAGWPTAGPTATP